VPDTGCGGMEVGVGSTFGGVADGAGNEPDIGGGNGGDAPAGTN